MARRTSPARSAAPPSAPRRELTHLDASGRAAMVDVSPKPVTRRIARASCRVLLTPATARRLERLPKGDAIAVARLAGIQAAKRTGELVPLAHPLPLDHVEVTIELQPYGASIESRIVVTARTGAEMEAMAACAGAALALYDMVKGVERGAVITDLRLETKSGGKSGEWKRSAGTTAVPRARRTTRAPRRRGRS
jgi:cyclic pyranopterin phosphate synthase